MTALNADQSYRALCKIQKCFRARLTPKPWRMIRTGGSNVGTVQLTRRLDFTPSDYLTFRTNYLAAMSNHSTCHFVRIVGNPIVVPECQQIVAVHDLRARALAATPLA